MQESLWGKNDFRYMVTHSYDTPETTADCMITF